MTGGSRVGVLDSAARHIAFPFCFYEIFGKGPMDRIFFFLKGILNDDNEV